MRERAGLFPSDDGWSVVERRFDPEYFGKAESLMLCGNGQLGLRSSHEEAYAGQTRGLYLAGFWDDTGNESAELPNLPDPSAMDLTLDGARLDLLACPPSEYQRSLDLRTGELVRSFAWSSGQGKPWRLTFRRFASMARPGVLAFRTELEPPEGGGSLGIRVGIDGRVTNSGTQHFTDGDRRVERGAVLEYSARTLDSGSRLRVRASFGFKAEGGLSGHLSKRFVSERRRLSCHLETRVGGPVVFERWAMIHSAPAAGPFQPERDPPMDYQALLEESARAWAPYWALAPDLESARPEDAWSLRTAWYHVWAMTPHPSKRLSVGAKGLSGEGYRGHVFWDAELFILPCVASVFPRAARSMLEYRVDRLSAARSLAARRAYQGAMFPWESALSGDDETPASAGMDKDSGLPVPVHAGLREVHVSADIAHAMAAFARDSGDSFVLDQGGAELILELAWFWCSRAAWRGGGRRCDILDVVGPDEYSERVDNNAYTNYLAHESLESALDLYGDWEPGRPAPAVLGPLWERLDLAKRHGTYRRVRDALYLPLPGPDGILPQDDTFLGLPSIDVAPYRVAERKQAILFDYRREELNRLQVLKQADAVMLMYLRPDMLSRDQGVATYRHYESRTVHDSSLSPGVHAVVAARLGLRDEAYARFLDALDVDLGPRPHSSDDGIHAAGLASVWMAAVQGFGGLRMDESGLSVSPALPQAWSSLSYFVRWRGRLVRVRATQASVELALEDGPPCDVTVLGSALRLDGSLLVRADGSGARHG